MDWQDARAESIWWARLAQEREEEGSLANSQRCYGLAAEHAETAMLGLPEGDPDLLGSLLVSAVSLWIKAREYAEARELADRWINTTALPESAVRSLQGFLRSLEKEEQQHQAAHAKRPTLSTDGSQDKRRAYVGLSSPIAFDFKNTTELIDSLDSDAPNPILEDCLGLLVLYDEILFASRHVCPRNMRDLDYVTFLNEQPGFNEKISSARASLDSHVSSMS